jgi:glucose uptake protein
MIVIQSYATAVILCVITMLCWGSWANTQKLAKKSWSFQLYYWDYGIGVVLISFVLGITMGSFGTEGRAFLPDLAQADFTNYVLAFLGGVTFNIANILLVAAIDIAGMAVAFPVGIGLALVIGVIVNYISDPVGDPVLLFIGVACVAAAIIIDALAYKRLSSNHGNKAMLVKGLIIAIIAGILMGFFYRIIAASISMNFANPASGMFTPYSAVFIFSIGLFASSFIFNTFIMKKPFIGKPIKLTDYFTKGTPWLHFIGILGGIIWGVGIIFNFMASELAGTAISYGLGQGATMIAALWGVFIWREFKHAPLGTNKYLFFMFCFYLAGLILIILAK